jgi:hypothetical protein
LCSGIPLLDLGKIQTFTFSGGFSNNHNRQLEYSSPAINGKEHLAIFIIGKEMNNSH